MKAGTSRIAGQVGQHRVRLARIGVERQRQLLERFGLPVRLTTAASVERSLDLMCHDKKTESGRVRFVVPTFRS